MSFRDRKKIRGLKRNCKLMTNRLIELSTEFPVEDYNGYWHLHLPVAQSFIDSPKTPKSVQRLCIQTLVERVSHLIKIKPETLFTRVIAAINLPELWNSQIIVFYDQSSFDSFFRRDSDYQKWIPLTQNRDIKKEWAIDIPVNLDVKGYREIINEEDYSYEGEIWFIGELT